VGDQKEDPVVVPGAAEQAAYEKGKHEGTAVIHAQLALVANQVCYAMLCYAMLCYAMLCYAVLYHIRYIHCHLSPLTHSVCLLRNSFTHV
jgi:hypothetical protein